MTSDIENDRDQLAKELRRLRQRVADLEARERRLTHSDNESTTLDEDFRGMYENSMLGLYRTTPDGRILMANPALVGMLGYASLEESQQRNLEQEGYEPGYPRSVFKETIEDQGQVVGLESVWTRRDGTALYVRESARVVRDDSGKVLYYQGTVEDISERKQAEDALRASETKYRTLVENLPQSVFVKNTNLEYVSCNENYANDFGMVSGEIVGKTDYDLYPSDVAESHEADDRRIITSGQAGEKDDVCLATGHERIVHIVKTPVRDDAGEITGMLGIYWDVTEKKLAEKALAERVKELTCLYRVGRALHENLSTEEMCTTVVERVAGAVPSSEAAVASIELDGRVFACPGYSGDLAHSLRADISARGECRGHLSVCYTVEEEPFLIPGAQDLVNGIAGLVGQWLERRDAEERLREYSKRLENMVEERTEELKATQQELLRKEKLAVLGQLAGGVGHELRNPLAVISNAIYYLRMKLAQADQDTKEYLGIIDSEVRNSEKIVSDLLDFSRAGPSEPERVHISKLVADVLQRLAIPGNTAVDAEIPSDLPPVIVDPLQMAQVLANLITNAHQAMPQGGNLKIAAEARDGKAHVSVSDDGCGISEQNVGRLFEPLFTTKPRGVGLGLPICRMLVQANGGSIKVRSEEGEGSTFTLILPTEDEQQPGHQDQR